MYLPWDNTNISSIFMSINKSVIFVECNHWWDSDDLFIILFFLTQFCPESSKIWEKLTNKCCEDLFFFLFALHFRAIRKFLKLERYPKIIWATIFLYIWNNPFYAHVLLVWENLNEILLKSLLLFTRSLEKYIQKDAQLSKRKY